MEKKSYNPFKMFGSYVGVFIGIIPSVFLLSFMSAFDSAHGLDFSLTIMESIYISTPIIFGFF